MKRERALLIAASLLLAAAGFYWWQRSQPAGAVASTFRDTADKVAATVFQATGVDLMSWQQVAARPENSIYIQLLHGAEARHGIPANLLVRLAYQESRFRQDIITGKTISSAGALGIMQIVPRWHPNVNPLDPAAAIDYAAKYLAQLNRQFGNWEHALQAYNWGPGNLMKYLANGGALPVETSNYSGQILADLRQTGSVIA